MENYNEGWNAAILEVVRRLEVHRDHSYAMEKWAEQQGLSGLVYGYKADGYRDMADIIRPMLQVPHSGLPLDDWTEPLFPKLKHCPKQKRPPGG